MKQFIDSINSGANARLRNPILGGFILSWIIFNWKPVLYVLLSDSKVEKRFKYVDSHLTNPWNGVVWPLITSLAIFLMLPYLMWVLEMLTRYGRFLRKTQRSLDLNKDLLLEIERLDLHQKLEDKKARYLDREQLNEKINALEDKIAMKDEDILSHNAIHVKVSDTLKQIQMTNSIALYFADEVLSEDSLNFLDLPSEIHHEVKSSLVDIAFALTTYDRFSELSMVYCRSLLSKNELPLKIFQDQGVLDYTGKLEDDFTNITKWTLTPAGLRTVLEIQKNSLEEHLSFKTGT